MFEFSFVKYYFTAFQGIQKAPSKWGIMWHFGPFSQHVSSRFTTWLETCSRSPLDFMRFLFKLDHPYMIVGYCWNIYQHIYIYINIYPIRISSIWTLAKYIPQHNTVVSWVIGVPLNHPFRRFSPRKNQLWGYPPWRAGNPMAAPGTSCSFVCDEAGLRCHPEAALRGNMDVHRF